MKKLISMLLAVLMVVGMFPVSALAEENPTITLTSGVSEAKIGDTIEVTAAVANNPGFSSMALSLQYDEEVLEFKGIKKEQNLYGQEVTAGLFGAGTCEYNGNKIAFAGTSDIAVDNTLFIAVFEVIGSGETDVSVSVEEFKNASGTSFAEAAVVVSSPSVKVEPEIIEPFTIVTGDTYSPNSYLAVIKQCVVEGVKVLNCKVESSGTKWTLLVSPKTDLGQEFTYTLTTSILGKPERSDRTNVSFEGGSYTAVSENGGAYTITFSGVPNWVNGEATVTFATRYQDSTKDNRNRAYTLILKLDDGINDTPVLAGDASASAEMRVNETYSVDLTKIFTDPDNIDLEYEVSINGGEAVPADAAYIYVPSEIGTYTLVFTANDGESTSEAYTVTLNVNGNAAPVLAGSSEQSVSGMRGIEWKLDLAPLFTDADGDALTYTVSVNGAEPVSANATYSYVPEKVGTDTFVFKAFDTVGAESPEYTLTLEVAENPAPVLAGDAEASASVDQYNNWTLDLNTIFTDNEGDAFTYTVSVDGAAAVAAAANYSYTANTEGEYKFVFVATDKAGNVSPEYTVNLKVNQVSRTVINTNCAKTSASFDGWLSTITVTGPKIDFYEWIGGGAGHDETSNEAHTLNIKIDSSYGEDGTIALAWALGGNTGQVKYQSTPPASVTLVDGKATVNVTTTYKSIAGWVTPRNYTINFNSQANNLPEAITEAISADVEAGKAYEINLAEYFTDKDGDNLTYYVSVNGADFVKVDAAYSYIPGELGEHTLVFKANDVWDDSEKNLTVTLNVANSDKTYDVNVNVPEGYEIVFKGVSNIVNGEIATNNELVYENGVVKVPENISVIAWAAEGAAGGTAAVKAGDTIEIKAVNFVAKTLTGEADDAAVINVTDANGAVITLGESKVALLAAGEGYSYKATPSSAYSGNWSEATISKQTVTGEDVVLEFTIQNPFTFTVTTGATAKMYKYNRYYDNTSYPVLDSKDNGDGTTTYYFNVNSKEVGLIYYAFMEGKITKAGWVKWGETSLKIDFTEDDYSADARFDYSVKNGSYLVKGIEEDNVLLNVNAQNALNLSVGGTKTLKGYRAWEIIPRSYENHIITPNFHFNVVWESEEGVVSLEDKVSPSAGNGKDWQTLKGEKEGIAIIEVTYDAIQVDGGSYDGYYGATDPARSGLVVVQVGGTKANVNFGIDGKSSQGSLIYESNTKKNWDAEFDTLYFTEDSGEIKLSPSSEETITEVAVSGNKGASWTVINAENGVYTAPIVHGNNIIRITTDKGIAYQVVRGYKVTVTVSEQTGDGDGVIEPGETARVTFKGLHQPIPKMAGNYNPGYRANTDGDGGTHVSFMLNGSRVSGAKSQYSFASNANYIDIVIPEEDAKSEYVLSDGCIATGVIGLTTFADGGDSHRNIPDAGCTTRGDKTTYHTRAVLPDVTIEVAGSEEVHEHSFIKEVADEKYFISAADCENPAVYKVSCECGEAGTETFKYGEALGHKDENKDHVCDNNCGIAQGEHADTNKDHACDYGCSVAIGTCEDANKDHACDYGCGKAYGEHKDSADDKDHVCDYCNSDEVLEECSGGVANCTEKATCSVCGEKYGEIDSDAHDWNETAYSWAENGTNCTASRVCKNNETHVEYAPATVTFAEKTPANCTEMGWTTYTATFAEDWAKTQTKDVQDIPALEHKDENRDHVCDNSCGIVQGEHVDSDKDHVCDYGCSVAIGTCEDTDKDHVCDYGCGKAYGTCEDTNKDHACDYGCGKAYGEHKDSADDKDHVCDYGCRAVLEECSGGVANCTEKATCSVCGEKYGDIDSDAHAWTVSYNWSEDGKACTATKACANNAEHNLTAEATVTSVVAKEANCSVMGDTQYTATFAADWAETQVTVRTDIAIDEDAHEWGEWEVVKEASYTEEGSKKRVCENDESHVETETIAKLVPTATEKTEGPDDTKEYVVAYQEGVVMVPAGLENEYPNQQAVKDALKAKVENGDLEDEVNLVFREVTVGYYENGVFVPVSNREFFENGKTIDILLKYPEGADKNDKFEVYHLRDDGVIEKCEIKGKTDEGIVIEVGSLSPFVIAYSKNIEEEDKFTWEDLFNWFEDHTKPSKPSNKPNPGITIITPEDEKEEANPNTGAPVIGIAPFAVLAVAAFAAGRKMKK